MPKIKPVPPPPKREDVQKAPVHKAPPMKNEYYRKRFGVGKCGKGAPLVFDRAELITEACDEYLQYCAENPLKTEKQAVQNGKVIRYEINKARIPSILGFVTYHGFTQAALRSWANGNLGDDYAEAAQDSMARIKAAQIELGAASLTDPAFTARVAGLAEKVEQNMNVAPAPAQKQDPSMVADVMHPDMTLEQEQALREAGVPIPLYSEAQLKQGVPFFMPALPGKLEE